MIEINETTLRKVDGLIVDTLGNTGYYGHFTGGWICYTCGPYCDNDLHGDYDDNE